MIAPFYSIIVPVYKTEQYIKECVNSILQQSYLNYEIILVDDGSPDKAPAICDDYAKTDSRISVIHKENGGLSSARNAGLSIAKGEYILFIDSDDRYHCNNVLKKLYHFIINENKPDIVIFGVEKFNQTTNITTRGSCFNGVATFNGTYSMLDLMRCNAFIASACNKAVKLSYINKLNARFPIGKLSEDIEWSANLIKGNPSTSAINELFYDYRKGNSQSITANISIQNLRDVLDIISKFKNSNNELLLHYIANQYILLVTLSNQLNKKDYTTIKNDLKNLWWLIKFNAYPYTRKISYIRILGYEFCRILLGLYKKYKD